MFRVNLIWACAVVFVGFSAVSVGAQVPSQDSQASAKDIKAGPSVTVPPAPALTAIRKATIGMSADELRDLWGKPKIEDKDGFIYELTDGETAQIVLDADGKIVAIAVTYAGGKGAPAVAEVFGPNVTPQKQPNGSIYHMVRYPAAGYWVSYYAGSGDNPMATLTMRKL